MAELAATASHGAEAETLSQLARDGERRLVWSGSWLDDPYEAGPMTAGRQPVPTIESRLRDLADSLEELIEDFEEEDPVRNANGVQTGSLAYAIVSGTAARLRRLGR